MVNEEATSITEEFAQLKSIFSNDNIDWVKYVNDHYQQIFETAQSVEVDKSDTYWKFFRMEDFLRDYNCDPNIGWIVLMINQIPSTLDFKDIDNILIPDPDTLHSLRQSYMQYRSHVKSCRN